MKQESKLNQHEQHQEGAEQRTEKTALEFATAEDMLRFDAAHTPVPAGIGERLKQSSRDIPPPGPAPWWKRLFGQ